jgi:hypothetical protein
MSVFDLDGCRECGAPVGHQEDYCADWPNCKKKRVAERSEVVSAPEPEVDETITECGHFAYRNYYFSPADFGCAGCENDMPPDAPIEAKTEDCPKSGKVDSVDGGARPDHKWAIAKGVEGCIQCGEAREFVDGKPCANPPDTAKIQGFVSRIEALSAKAKEVGIQKPEPDSREWWKQVAQGLQAELWRIKQVGDTDGGARELEQAAQRVLDAYDNFDSGEVYEAIDALRLAMERKAGR